MPAEEKIKIRIKDLIIKGEELSHSGESGRARSEEHVANCHGWLAGASNILHLACGEGYSPYKDQFQKIIDKEFGYVIPTAVGAGKAILQSLLIDIEEGLLESIADMARAETFDNFLDHAKSYHKNGNKNESGVIAGVIFEDSIRRVCEKNNIEQSGEKLDKLISALTTKAIISQTKAKRARAAAHVRTKATHAQWDEYDLNDVSVTIEFIEELIQNHIET